MNVIQTPRPSDAALQTSRRAPEALTPAEVSVSVVVYQPDMTLLARTLDSLIAAERVLRAREVASAPAGTPESASANGAANAKGLRAGVPTSALAGTPESTSADGVANAKVLRAGVPASVSANTPESALADGPVDAKVLRAGVPTSAPANTPESTSADKPAYALADRSADGATDRPASAPVDRHGLVDLPARPGQPDGAAHAARAVHAGHAGHVNDADDAPRFRYRLSVALVDNSVAPDTPDLSPLVERLRRAGIEARLIAGHGNVGYGRGHNLAIDRMTSAAGNAIGSVIDSVSDNATGNAVGGTLNRYHLILNPDVDLHAQALARAVDFLERHPSVGLLAPWIGDENGVRQHLCRRYPSVLDLFIRGFMPQRIRRRFARRLARYEMRDVINDTDIVWAPPIVSGCCMFFRTDALQRLGGFDPRYFLYFEDYDLSLRAHDVAQVAYVPTVRALHHGGHAARKGSAHIRMFAASACRFFGRFGWKWG